MKPAIIVMNGANGAAVEVKPLADLLAPFGTIYTPDYIGHGGRPLPPEMTTRAVVEDLVAFLDREKIARAVFVGFSLGGLIGLYLARHHPDRVIGVCGIATKYIFDEETVNRWVYLGDTERIARPGNPRKDELARAHFPQDWTEVTRATCEWSRDLGKNPPLTDADFAAIDVPVKLFSGTADVIVSVDEQKQLARMLRTRVSLFPQSAHPLRVAPLPDIAREIGKWIGTLAEPG